MDVARRSRRTLTELSAAQARRVALAAQGFGAKASSSVGLAKVRSVARRLGAIQIDSVNVLVRAHYVPVYSRHGPYEATTLDRLAYERGELFEYWGHAACLMPMELHPLLRWRMKEYEGRWARRGGTPEDRYLDAVLAEIAERGPISAGELSDPGTSKGPWWGWSEGKRAMEYLFATGRVTVASRRRFERLYDLTERVIDPDVFARSTPSDDEAKRELILVAARALGVGTAKDLGAYFYLSRIAPLITDLVEDGRLERVAVEGWSDPAYVLPGTRVPRALDARALVSPFDPLAWERSRLQRLFAFDYTIEIYVPAPKRTYGYYVLPFLLGDSIVARVDLKADRKAGVLRVPGAFAEPGVDRAAVTRELASELRRMAGWLDLDAVEVASRGDLARPLRRSIGSR